MATTGMWHSSNATKAMQVMFHAIRRQRSLCLAVVLVSAGFTDLAEGQPGEPIPIVLAAPATPAEQMAARTLEIYRSIAKPATVHA